MNKIQALNGKFTSLRDEVIAAIKSMSKDTFFSFDMNFYNLENEDAVKYTVNNGEITEVRSMEEEDFITIEHKDICLDDLVFIMEKCAEILEDALQDSNEDLFKFPELIPGTIQAIMDSADENEDLYKECGRMQDLMRPLGYTFNFGLDGEPYDLRKISEEEIKEELLQKEAKALLKEMGLNISLDEIKLNILSEEYFKKVTLLLNKFNNL